MGIKKSTILILLSVTSILGCDEDDGIQNSRGTRLIAIEHIENDKTWFENYTYTSNEKLDMVEDFYSLGRRYELQYENDRLIEYKTYRIDDNKLIFRDSIEYNSEGQIQNIYNFSINSGQDLPLTRIYEFEYDNQNMLFKKKTYFVNIEEYTSIEKFYWSGNNIEKAEYYNGEEELYYEYFYTYDDKINYKKGLPIHISNPINWSANNVLQTSYKDHVGNLDLICGPCTSVYKYNLDNYPVSIKLNWGKEMMLTYE